MYITTLGCAKNLVDSERLMGKLNRYGIALYHEKNPDHADIAIVNTCGFIGDAREESIDTILRMIKAKKQGIFKQVIVMGCLSERYREDLLKELPEVDGIFGVDQQAELLQSIGINYRKELAGERILTTPSHYAYLKIAEGCDRECSFCAIPSIRGKHISKPIEMLVEEAEILAGRGVKELNVISQDTTFYGLDLYGKRELAGLLSRLSDVKGLEWIRLHYAYPLGFPLEILDVIRERPNLCNYIDIPLQHIDTQILKSMRRGVSRQQTEKLLDTIRKQIPGVAIRTTMIVGYPGETRKSFEELLQFVEEQRFERLGVFAYSPEEGTPAFPLGDPVSEEEKKDRIDELMQLQSEISLELNEAKIGKTERVIVDRFENGQWFGRTAIDSPEVDNEVIIHSEQPLETGSFYNVKITRGEFFDVFAEIV